MTTEAEWKTFYEWLLKPENGYAMAIQINDEKYAVLNQGIANGQVIIGKIGDTVAWDERYDYVNMAHAIGSLSDWEQHGFEGEPQGWVRHIPSNRRREDGDPNRETVRP